MKLKSRITMVLAGAVIGIVFLAGLPTMARADLITYNFSGTVDTVDSALSSIFSSGQTLTGSYTFDSTTSAVPGSTSAAAVYYALTSVSFTVGSYTASSTATQEIQVENGATDTYTVVSRKSDGLNGADVAGLPLSLFTIRLDDSSGTVFSDALILPTGLVLSNFSSKLFFLDFGDLTAPSVVSGTITELSQPAPVPLPGAFLLFGSGLAGLSMLRLRRKG